MEGDMTGPSTSGLQNKRRYDTRSSRKKLLDNLDKSDVELSDLEDFDDDEDADPTYDPEGPKDRLLGNFQISESSSSEADEEEDSPQLEEWIRKTDFNPPNPPDIMPYDTVNCDGWDQLSYFNQYIDEKLFAAIAEKTNQTSVFLHSKCIKTSENEISKWFGISLIMASLQYPKIRMYWEKKWRVPLIAESMTRDRYFKIRASLKIVFDEDISSEERAKDRLWKIRPFLERVREGCLKQPRSPEIAVDEMIIPFEGRCGLKTFTRNKPNPWGLKAFVLASPEGIVYDFIVYQGSATYPDEIKDYLKGTAAVLSLTNSLHPGHVIYHDRYFTSPELADKLYERDLRSTGTVQVNRLPKFKDVTFIPDKELKQHGRGSADTLVRKDEKLSVTKWFDSKSVYMLSNHTAISPFDLCERWCKKTKKFISVPRPAVIKKYNENMGGIDLANRLNSVCVLCEHEQKNGQFVQLCTSQIWQ